jgi:hypothetical protein
MVKKINLQTNNHLTQFGRILNYQLSFAVLTLGYLVLFLHQGIFIILIIITLAALIFSPYLLFVLKRENRKGWIYFFLVIVILPAIISTVLYLVNSFLLPLLFIPLFLFYLYCFLLRFSVNEWLADLRTKNIRLIQKEKREEELNAFMKK